MSRAQVLPFRLAIPRLHGAAALFLLSTSPGLAAQADPAGGLLALCLATLPEARPDGIWTAWSLAPAVVLPTAAAGALYARGWRVAWSRGSAQRASATQATLFAAGIACIVIALMSPLCRMASTLASAHMVQHVLLVVGAPLLLAMSRPGRILVDGLPMRIRGRVAAWSGAPSAPPRPGFLLASFLLYGASIWVWHIPALYEAALLNPAIHLLMIASLLIVSLIFWHAALDTYRMPGNASGIEAMLLFLTFLHTGALGVFLTLSLRLWYPLVASRSAVWGLSPIDDQQLAGLIMWIPMGSVYAAGGLAILARLITSPGLPSSEEAHG